MAVYQIPTDDAGKKGSSGDSEDDSSQGDRNYPGQEYEQEQEQEPSPPAPGAPILDYQFGVSQGWNGDSTFNTSPTLIQDDIKAAVEWAKDNKIPALVKATAELGLTIAFAKLAIPLRTVALLSTAMDFTYSATNTAVHLGGGGDSLEKASGLFDPFGLITVTGETLAGRDTKTALRDAGLVADVHTVVDGLAPGHATTTIEGLVAAARKVNVIESLQNLGILSGPSSIPTAKAATPAQELPPEHPMCPVRKPGGPFVIKAP